MGNSGGGRQCGFGGFGLLILGVKDSCPPDLPVHFQIQLVCVFLSNAARAALF